MKYTFHGKPSEKKGVVSNTHGFLYRNLDTGFKSKWSGFWSPPYKFLDYLAFQVNGIWLNENTINGVEYGEEMVLHHKTDTLEIEERITAEDGFPGFRIELELTNISESRNAVQAVMETGIDIRRRDNDVPDDEHEVERDGDRLIASREGRKLAVEPQDVSGFRGERYEKEHYPGERQVCTVPERPVFRRELEKGESTTVAVEFKTSKGSFYELETRENMLDHDLGRLFRCSIDSLENLTYSRNGVGVIAGHPWFQSYWARDSFWSLLGLIDAGYFETSRKVLENFAEKSLNSRVQLDGNREEDISRADTAPLFVIAADKLRRHDTINDTIREAMQDAMDDLTLQEGVVQHDADGTWMDTLEREKAVEIQSLWLEAARIMDDDRAEELGEGLERFRKDGILQDQLQDGAETVNAAVPLMFDQLEEVEKDLERINGEFSSRYGARTRSVTDPGYDSGGYHTGSVWGLTTCWAAAANLRHGRDRKGVNSLEKLDQFLDRNQPGALPEVVDAESGELIGAPEQAWSAGLMVHVIDSYMLGIEVKEDHVEIDPADVTATRRGKFIHGERLDLRVENGEVEILNDPDLDLRF